MASARGGAGRAGTSVRVL